VSVCIPKILERFISVGTVPKKTWRHSEKKNYLLLGLWVGLLLELPSLDGGESFEEKTTKTTLKPRLSRRRRR